MGLITKEMEIVLHSNNIRWYKEKGYNIPKEKDNHRRFVTPKGSKIIVKVEDLTNGHNIVDCECDECKKPLKMTWYTYKNSNHDGKTYCHSCAQKKFNSGKKHPNYNPNITDEEREKGRNYPEYKEFIQKVLARDNYTCQCCGKKATNVHHLYAYASYPEYRTDETQALCLCDNCHSSFHGWHLMTYGYDERGKNTKKQFEEWSGMRDILLEEYNGELPTVRIAYCITDNQIINNITEFAKENNLSYTNIYKCCNGEENMYRKKIYIWYDVYKQMNDEELKSYIKKCKSNGKTKEVVCINYKLAFYSVNDASVYFGIPNTNIIRCCKRKLKSAGKSITGEKLIWAYAYDIENISEYTYVSQAEIAKKLAEVRSLNTKFEGETEVVL